MELCEALDKLLELWPLFWIQSPATRHYSKPETSQTKTIQLLNENKSPDQLKCKILLIFSYSATCMCVMEKGSLYLVFHMSIR